MSANLIIVGASGLGKEVLWLAQRADISVRGFLDDAEDKQGMLISGLPVLGKIADAANHRDAEFCVAIGQPRAKAAVVRQMRADGISSFATLMDPAACVGPQVKVGAGSIICAGAMATVDIEIGKFVLVDRGAVVGHDSVVGDFATIAPLASVSGNVTISRGVEIGTNASVRQGLKLGSGAMLGMGAVLVRNLADKEVAVGNPAKTLRFLEHDVSEDL